MLVRGILAILMVASSGLTQAEPVKKVRFLSLVQIDRCLAGDFELCNKLLKQASEQKSRTEFHELYAKVCASAALNLQCNRMNVESGRVNDEVVRLARTMPKASFHILPEGDFTKVYVLDQSSHRRAAVRLRSVKSNSDETEGSDFE